MRKIKTILYVIILSTFFKVGNAIGYDFGLGNVNEGLVGSNDRLDTGIQRYIVYILQFLTLAAIIYGLYGGYMILTAGNDDDKVKNGKTVIIRAIIGLIVILLASPIVGFFIGSSGILTSGG